MKLIIERQEEKKERDMYNELLFISSKYNNIIKNPRLKVHKVTNILWGYLIIGILFLAFFTYLMIKRSMPIYLVLIVILVCCIAFSLRFLVDSYKFIKTELSKKLKTELTINASGVRLNKGKSYDYKMSWKDIAYVIVNKHSIVFLPKERTMLIGLNSCYNGQVVKALIDEKKEDLLVDNGSLYS